MIRAAVGLSTHPDSARAALEVSGQVIQSLRQDGADWCVAFATPEHAPQIATLLEALSGALGTPYVVGCSASGVLGAGREIERGPALGVLAVVSDQLRATPFLFQDEGDQGMTAGVRLGQRMISSRDSEDMLLVWPDPFHVRPDRLLKSLDALLGSVPVIGGAASGRGSDSKTFQFCGSECNPAAVSGLRLAGRFRHRVGITQGCRPLGRPLQITRAHENLILELEGRPPQELLSEHAPNGLLADPEWAFNFLFVGLLPDGATSDGYLVRNIVASDPEAGVLAISDHVEEGQHLLFALREADSARQDLLRLLDGVNPQRTGLDYRFGLYFNCLARGSSLYQEPGVDAKLLERALPGVPLLGFFCNAEIGPLRGLNHLFTYTGVLALFAE